MPSLEAENLIAHLSRQLAPADREAFRRAAESALDTPQCWGLGLIHRTVVGVWRGYFHPPTDGHIAAWEREQREINKRRLGGVSACVSTAASHATSHICAFQGW